MTGWKLARAAAAALFVVGLQAAYAGQFDATFKGSWRSGDVVVDGWDWSLPEGVKASPRSGVFIGDSVSGFPSGFPGNKLKKVDTTWRELEPSPGKWNFGPFLAALEDDQFDGAMVNIRSAVWFTEEPKKCGSAASCLAKKNLRTAPDWICNGNPRVVVEDPKGPHGSGFTQHNVDISQPCYKNGLIRVFDEMKKRGIPSMRQVQFVILHGSGDSKGEEWSGKQSRSKAGRQAMREIVRDGWVAAFSPNNVWKLGWPKATVEVPEDEDIFFFCRDVGCGQRNSNAENWMIHFPKPEIGQMLADASGRVVNDHSAPIDLYLKTDESNVFIRENRHFQDQNEQYQGSFAPPERYGEEEFFQLRYRQATLAMLHVRRNVIWTEPGSHMNPELLSWASLELGKNVDNAPDAWVQLMQTPLQVFGKARRINNLERWLYQRDINGVSTTPTARQMHSKPLRPGEDPPFKPGGKKLPNDLNYIDLARTGHTIGIAVDDRFLSGGPHEVAIKVTFLDKGRQPWSLSYAGGKGRQESREIQSTGTNEVRTATFLLDDFVAKAEGFDFDFRLESDGETPFMFVRLVKMSGSPGSGGLPGAPEAPSDFREIK